MSVGAGLGLRDTSGAMNLANSLGLLGGAILEAQVAKDARREKLGNAEADRIFALTSEEDKQKLSTLDILARSEKFDLADNPYAAARIDELRGQHLNTLYKNEYDQSVAPNQPLAKDSQENAKTFEDYMNSRLKEDGITFTNSTAFNKGFFSSRPIDLLEQDAKYRKRRQNDLEEKRNAALSSKADDIITNSYGRADADVARDLQKLQEDEMLTGVSLNVRLKLSEGKPILPDKWKTIDDEFWRFIDDDKRAHFVSMFDNDEKAIEFLTKYGKQAAKRNVIKQRLEERLEIGGFKEGYADSVLRALATKAKYYNLQSIIVEPNFGNGMFAQLLRPVVLEIYPGCVVDDAKAASAQKEARIIDTLEPVMMRHKLIVDKQVIEDDYKVYEKNSQYSLFYQMTRLSRDRGALAHDDRIDAVAGGVEYFRDMVSMSEQQGIEQLNDELLERWLDPDYGVLYVEEDPNKIKSIRKQTTGRVIDKCNVLDNFYYRQH